MKRKRRFSKKRIRGSITILLIIILIPSILLSGIIVDTSRVNIGKAAIASAGDLAMSTALSKYDTIVKDVYGLFAMSQNMTDDERTAMIRSYFERTLVSYGVVDEAGAGDYLNTLLGDFKNLMGGVPNGDIVNLLGMEIPTNDDFKVITPKESSLANPGVMRKQIVDYMKFRGPINFGLSIFDVANSFKTIDKQSEVVEKQVEAQESMQDVVNGCRVTIKGIREYDDLLKDIRTGGRMVAGREKYGDDKDPVQVEDYRLQILKYRTGEYEVPGVGKFTWDNNYKHINKLIMCFLLKAPKTDGMYLTGQIKKSTNEYFVTDEGINTKDSGVSASASTSSDEGTARSDFYAQYNKFNSGLEYDNISKAYLAYDFVSQSYISGDDKLIYAATESAAIESFVEYEKFLADAEGAKCKYSDVKKVFEALFVLDKLYKNYDSILEKKETKAQKEYDNAASALSKVENEISDIESDIKAEQAKLKKASTPAEIASITEKINKLNDKKSAKETEKTPLADDKAAKEQALKAIQDIRKNVAADYKNCTGRYVSLCRNYIWDLNDYSRYQSAATHMVSEEIRKIDEQFSLIVDNLCILSQALGETAVNLSQILIEVEKYENNVKSWKASNDSYIGANGNDTFSAANAGEIESSHKNINKEEVESLITYVKSIDEEYQTLYNFITDSGTSDFKYGNKKVYEISDYKTAVKIAGTKESALPDIVKESDADAAFNGLYAESVLLDVFNDQGLILSLIEPEPIRLSFLVYLDRTYPEESESTDDTENKKYEEMMTNLKSDNNGKAISDGDDYTNQYVSEGASATANTSGLSYTYKGKKISGDDLPTSIYTAKAKETTTQSLKIEQKGDKIEASQSLKSNRSGLSAAIGGIGNIASTSLENIYIINYMFENFSYNTMMQDMIIKGEKVEHLIDAKAPLGNSSIIEKYEDKAVTLSNVPINRYNNYLYGAEIEYMVYGNRDIGKNVTSAKASIYAIRCAFNMIYAFTNPDIRTETRNIGLAVQAATLNIVPYQVVQVVLQLALAFAESAIDLTAICNGISVVLFKSEETWNLSIKKSVEIVGDYLAEAASEYAKSAITSAGEALQKVVDAKADELIGAVNSLAKDLEAATTNELKKIVGQGFKYFENQLFLALDNITLINYNGFRGTLQQGLNSTEIVSADNVTKKINAAIDEACADLSNKLDEAMEGVPLFGDELKNLIVTKCDKIKDDLKVDIADYITKNFSLGPDGYGNATELICGKLKEWQENALAEIDDAIGSREIEGYISSGVNKTVNEISGELQSTIAGYSADLSEEAAATIKEKVTSYTSSFINNYIPGDGTTGIGNTIGNGKNSESLGSIIKLGYKDYLMLFAFIEISASEAGSDKILTRMADVIQLNIQNASGDSTYQHKKGQGFLMKNAYTYVGIDAKIDMDMLFIDMDLFRRSFDDETGTYDTALSKYGIIEYTGLQGY
ncbi:hypothetical protein SAMN02910339_01650 [Lachnospiraceae bacterium YSD2013]|nr:hypothetical protein SAMN02910339_01650 [Lachnospiraceae bacterium YSD2013]